MNGKFYEMQEQIQTIHEKHLTKYEIYLISEI